MTFGNPDPADRAEEAAEAVLRVRYPAIVPENPARHDADEQQLAARDGIVEAGARDEVLPVVI